MVVIFGLIIYVFRLDHERLIKTFNDTFLLGYNDYATQIYAYV